MCTPRCPPPNISLLLHKELKVFEVYILVNFEIYHCPQSVITVPLSHSFLEDIYLLWSPCFIVQPLKPFLGWSRAHIFTCWSRPVCIKMICMLQPPRSISTLELCLLYETSIHRVVGSSYFSLASSMHYSIVFIASWPIVTYTLGLLKTGGLDNIVFETTWAFHCIAMWRDACSSMCGLQARPFIYHHINSSLKYLWGS